MGEGPSGAASDDAPTGGRLGDGRGTGSEAGRTAGISRADHVARPCGRPCGTAGGAPAREEGPSGVAPSARHKRAGTWPPGGEERPNADQHVEAGGLFATGGEEE